MPNTLDPISSEMSAAAAAQIQMLLEVSRTLAVTTDLDELLMQIARAGCSLLNCERSSIWVHDAAKRELWTKVVLNCDEIRVPESAGIVGAAFRGNQVVHSPNPYDDPRFYPDSDRRLGFVTRNLLAAPMLDIGGKPVGVLEVVNKANLPFSPHDEQLIRLLANQAGVAIQRYRLQLAAERAAELRREMDLARRVQEAMFPKKLTAIAGYEIAAWAKPASITGGDCYDVWQLPDGRLALLLADASGHGMAAALIVSLVRTLVRGLCDLPGSLKHPYEILSLVNARLRADLEPVRFVTAFLGFVSLDGAIEWQSAGQGPILLRRSGADPVQVFDAAAPPMNADADFQHDPPTNLHIGHGGSLLLISDGIFEAASPSHARFGTERTVSLLSDPSASPETQLHQIREAVERWQETPEPADDQTIIVLSRQR